MTVGFSTINCGSTIVQEIKMKIHVGIPTFSNLLR